MPLSFGNSEGRHIRERLCLFFKRLPLRRLSVGTAHDEAHQYKVDLAVRIDDVELSSQLIADFHCPMAKRQM